MSSAKNSVRTRMRGVLGAAVAAALVTVGVGSAAPATAAANTPVDTITGLFAALGDQLGGARNTAWGTDPSTGQVVLTMTDAAKSTVRDQLGALAGRFGNKVRVEQVPGAFTPQVGQLLDGAFDDDPIFGGDRLASSDRVCSVGFNVARGGQRYVVTAGHCTKGMPEFNGVGPSVDSTFPGNDYGLVRNDDSAAFGGVNRYDGTWQRIVSVGQAYPGERVCKSGQTTGLTCGQVSRINETVNYGNGIVVHDLIRTNLHADAGDSGASLFDGPLALGTLSGGNGSTEFFNPLPFAMRSYQLRLI